ncbi:hypothetical protein BH11PSE10_BH11PSE10_09010 [soil metagenome]
MVEVKSSTSVKPYHHEDCAIQTLILLNNGIAPINVDLAHIDTSFVYQGGGDYRGLLHHHSLMDETYALIEFVPGWIQGARATLSGDEPDIKPGEQCDTPFECPFKAHCGKVIEPTHQPAFPLEVFSRMRQTKREEIRELGFQDAREVPTAFLNDTQQRIQRVIQTGEAELTSEAKLVLAELTYPRYYLDFETINLAVPRWPQTSPYRTQVPFQWSCHVEPEPGHLKHHMFLDVTGADPRRSCADSFVATLGTEGPVFVYFQAFEKGRIAELAVLYPDLAPALLAINERIVDLLPLTRTSYYHSDMQGSWSIKSVLPTIAPELSYVELAVSDGGGAQDAYREILHPMTSASRRQELEQGLRDYCTLDTLAMVRLAWFLEGYSIWHFRSSLVAGNHADKDAFALGLDLDLLFNAAVDAVRRYCLEANTPYVRLPKSLLQQRLRIGFEQSAALVEQLEAAGVLTPLASAVKMTHRAAESTTVQTTIQH